MESGVNWPTQSDFEENSKFKPKQQSGVSPNIEWQLCAQVLRVKFEKSMQTSLSKRGIKFVSLKMINAKNMIILWSGIVQLVNDQKDGICAIWNSDNEGTVRIGSEERFRLSLLSHSEFNEKRESGKEIAAHYYRVSKIKKHKMAKGWIPLLIDDSCDKKKNVDPCAQAKIAFTIHNPRQIGYIIEMNFDYKLWRAYPAPGGNLLELHHNDVVLNFKKIKPTKVPYGFGGNKKEKYVMTILPKEPLIDIVLHPNKFEVKEEEVMRYLKNQSMIKNPYNIIAQEYENNMIIPQNIDKEELQCCVISQSPFHTGFRYEGLNCHMFRIDYHEVIVSCDQWKGMFLLQQESPYNIWFINQKCPTEENPNEHKTIGKFMFENKKFSQIKSFTLIINDCAVDCTLLMAIVNGFYILQYNYLKKMKAYAEKNKLAYKSDIIQMPSKSSKPSKSKGVEKNENKRNSLDDF